MRMILREYSLAVIYVLAVVSVLGFIMYSVNDPSHGMTVTYNTNMVYANDFYAGTENAGGSSLSEYESNGMLDGIDAVDNTVAGIKKPAFSLDSSVMKDDYIIPVPTGAGDRTYYTYDEALSLFSANGKISLNKVVNGSYTNVGLPSDVEIVVVKISPTERGVEGDFATERVPARDKYGNIIRNAGGSIVEVEQVLYIRESYNRANFANFYIDWSVSSRYKVYYRYTQNGIKSEYSAMFVNKIKPAVEIYEEVVEEIIPSS